MKSMIKFGSLLATLSMAGDIKEDLKSEQIEQAVAIFRSISKGLNLYQHVDGLTICDFETQ